ncbi:spore germination protein [Paenibacillus sp. CGMCC 1.16610]|uniref:Spore gernimation protein GerA n=1 Tax=Paenibacillus anseongense TaxID=2682845 RepID=A0ABW9UE48_9BACL|nr:MULTISPECIES: spore germination protein [Paenibacillus]MBA2937612.1 spore germination protein [Paenibacillus sp. CGMCC 1.16610]MVQ36670.1 spore gernimation protein GerA [Paenibacillus anseongense]
MSNFLEIIGKKAELHRDLKIERLQLGAESMWLVYYDSVVNSQETIMFIWNSGVTSNVSYDDICMRLVGKPWSPQAMSELQLGRVVLINATGEQAFSFQGVPTSLSRSIEKPENESMPFAPAIAFMEPLTTNIGLIRKSLNSPYLIAEGFTFTGGATKEASLIYHSELVNKELLRQVKSNLQNASNRDLQTGQDLMEILGCSRFDLLSPFYKTEIPMQATSSMMKGRVILLIDGEPVAYVLPLLFGDFISIQWDRQLPLLIMFALRFLRLMSLLISLLTPGLYVALVSVNPETLRIELALSVASSRIGIPLPTFLEMAFLLIVSEISIESTQRLPKSIAASITVIGGIVLGTAIVDAKLVSSLVIIVLSISVTATFAFPNYLNTLNIRIIRAVIVVLSGIFGVFGLFAGFIAICFYVCRIEYFGIPFMSFFDFKKLRQT